MSRLSIQMVEVPASARPRGWSKLRWVAWLTLFIALGVWAGLMISA